MVLAVLAIDGFGLALAQNRDNDCLSEMIKMTNATDRIADEDFGLSDVFPRNVNENFPTPEGAERVTLVEQGRYVAYAYDLDFMWRWVVTRDGEEVQDGPAISLESSRHCAKHVLAFYGQRDKNVANA